MSRLGIVSLTAFLSVAGLSFAEVQLSTTWASEPDIAWNGSRLGVIFGRDVGVDNLTLVTLDPPGTNPSREIVFFATRAVRNPVIVAGPGVWGAAWGVPENDGRKIYFAAFDDSGKFSITPMQISGTVGNPNEGASFPSMVWSGSRYYVAWQDLTPALLLQVELAAVEGDGTQSMPWHVLVPHPAGVPWIALNEQANSLGLV